MLPEKKGNYLLKIIFSLFLTLINSQTVFSQSCDDCSRPRIALYDFEMQVQRPDADTLIAKWFDLYWPGVIARSEIRKNELNKDCLVWIDGAVINANNLDNGTLKFGSEYLNLPPAGPLGAADYILSGYTTETAEGYQSVLTLETAESREIVKSVSVTFQNNTDAVTNAGNSLASQFGSIYSVIKNFEINKRNSDVEVAISDLLNANSEDVVKVIPSKTEASAGEEVDVEVILIDCDGVPLKGRTLYLTEITVEGNLFPGPENGEFADAFVVTDDEGKAKTKFTPAGPGLSVCNVNFPHKKPTGRKGGFIGTAYLNVPPETKQFKGIWSYDCDCLGDTTFTITESNGSIHTEASTNLFFNNNVKIQGIVQRNYDYTEQRVFDKILSVSASGSRYGLRHFNHHTIVTTEYGSFEYITIINENVFAQPEKEDVEFSYITEHNPSPSGYPEVGFTFSMIGDRKYIERTYNDAEGWQTNNWTFDWNDHHGMNFIDPQDGETITNSGDSYKCHHNKTFIFDDIEYEKSSFYKLNCRQTIDWTVTITPSDKTTGLNDKNSDNIPSGFSLEQNYPNPFNPATYIKFTIPVVETGHPSLSVNLKVYDLLGNEVAVLINEEKPAGEYEIEFNASKYNLTSGIYFYTLKTGNFTQTRKLLLLK